MIKRNTTKFTTGQHICYRTTHCTAAKVNWPFAITRYRVLYENRQPYLILPCPYTLSSNAQVNCRPIECGKMGHSALWCLNIILDDYLNSNLHKISGNVYLSYCNILFSQSEITSHWVGINYHFWKILESYHYNFLLFTFLVNLL